MARTMAAFTVSPRTADATAATKRIPSSGLAKLESSCRRAESRRACAGSFGPTVLRRRAASIELSPAVFVPKRSSPGRRAASSSGSRPSFEARRYIRALKLHRPYRSRVGQRRFEKPVTAQRSGCVSFAVRTQHMRSPWLRRRLHHYRGRIRGHPRPSGSESRRSLESSAGSAAPPRVRWAPPEAHSSMMKLEPMSSNGPSGARLLGWRWPRGRPCPARSGC